MELCSREAETVPEKVTFRSHVNELGLFFGSVSRTLFVLSGETKILRKSSYITSGTTLVYTSVCVSIPGMKQHSTEERSIGCNQRCRFVAVNHRFGDEVCLRMENAMARCLRNPRGR